LRRAAAAAAALALLAAGCGGDQQKQRTAGGGQETAARTATEPSRDTSPSDKGKTPGGKTTGGSSGGTTGGGSGGKSPEQQPGGAGDEEPARSQALLTGRGGRISPRLVQVPPFISVRVELRSADGRGYSLRIAGRRIAAGGGLASASTTLDGLRSGKAYVGRGSDGGRIRIEASAEPGP
jgi:hypothetical protein